MSAAKYFLRSICAGAVAVVLLWGIFALVPPARVSAADPVGAVCSDPNAKGSPVCDPSARNDALISGNNNIIIRASRIVAFGVGIAAVFAIIIAGIRFITAHGDPNSIASARNTILFAVIGLLVAVLAQAIIVFIVQRL